MLDIATDKTMAEILDREINPSRGNSGKHAERKAYKIAETADLLGVSAVSVRRLIDRGILKPTRVLRHVLISADQIDRLFRN